MAEIRVYPQGFRELARRVGSIEVAHVLEPPLIRGLERFRADLAAYPPQREGANYRRTGTLGRSWTIRHTVNARGIEGETGTNVAYGPYVQDEERQAWMHRGVWRNTDEQVAQRHRGAVLADFHAVIQRELERAR